MDTTFSPARRLIAAIAVAGALAVAAFAFAGFAGSAIGGTATLFAVASLGCAPLMAKMYARAMIPRAWAAAAFFPSTLTLVAIVLAANKLGDPIVRSHWHCGTGEMMVLMMAPFLFAAFGVVGGIMALPVAGAARPLNSRLLRTLSLGVFAVLAGLTVYMGARRLRLPEPSTFIASLPIVAVVPGVPNATAPTTTVKREDGLDDRVFTQEVSAVDLVLDRRCGQFRDPNGDVQQADYCSVVLSPKSASKIPSYPSVSVRIGDPVVIRRDEAHHLWIVTGAASAAYRDYNGALHAMDVYVGDVKGGVAPPWGWVAAALGAVGLFLGVEALRRWALAKLARIESAREGTLGEGGWIEVEGEAMPLRAAPDLGLVSGPVLVMPAGPKAPSGAYRGETPLGQGAVLQGERHDWVLRMGAKLAALDAFALSVAALGAAPLIAAWFLLR